MGKMTKHYTYEAVGGTRLEVDVPVGHSELMPVELKLVNQQGVLGQITIERDAWEEMR